MTLPSLLPWLLLAAGIVGLAVGASWLVDGASRLALRFGISPMVVGLTIVGFGTSMPEFSVSVLAAARGSTDLSLGNAVGSNIMNLLLVLGVAAVVVPIHVIGANKVLIRDLVFGLVPPVILLVMARDGDISRGTAILLLTVFVAFIWVALTQAKKAEPADLVVTGSPLRHLAVTVVGIAVLVGGSEMLVRGGVELARRFSVSEAVIGLTLVAFGTSLPELATSVTAVLKGESEIGVGNVLGSNIFNLGLVVGTAFFLRPGAISTFVVYQDIPILIASTFVVGLIVLRDGRISRAEGALMLSIFTAYLIFIGIRGS
jgi:cation:H+ antiporter